jgi:hypothetical protein
MGPRLFRRGNKFFKLATKKDKELIQWGPAFTDVESN